MTEKIRIELNGAAETMLQSFYARAQYSKSKRHKFFDAKAVELVERIDYDFSLAEKDSTMGTGVIARTIVFDELGDVANGYRKVKDDNIMRGMIKLYPVLKVFKWLPFVEKVTEKILIFEKI